jgi:hypothetical protein
VMGQDSQQFVREQPYQGLLVNAVAAAWSELDGEGERYSSGGPTPSRFWKAARTPKFALARMGVPAEMLVQLPRGGFSEYLALLASRQS